jgi:uracil-DNA glycosylase family 4
MTNPFVCPICNNAQCVPPHGNENSPILVVAEFPGIEEIKKGRPMIGRMGNVLRLELGKLGVDLHRMRIMNLWQHKPNGNEECYNLGFKTVIKEAKGKKAILLLGNETVKAFCDEKVSDVCGLNVESFYLSAPIIVACVNPAIAFHSPIGELRLALSKFVYQIEEILK